MKKIIFALTLGILILGLISAAQIINVTPVNVGTINVVAGGTNSTTFSFSYPNKVKGDYNNAPLVIRVNITNATSETPEVWKGDFQVNMFAEQYLQQNKAYNTIPMTCNDAPINFKTNGNKEYSIEDVPNGTFYCYNQSYRVLQLGTKDKINLSFSPNIALWPGNYDFNVDLLDLEPNHVSGGTEGNNCEVDWQCGNWGECINGTQTRTCTDLNHCSIDANEPPITKTCVPESSTISDNVSTGFFSGFTGAVIGAWNEWHKLNRSWSFDNFLI